MKPYREQTYYELLELPTSASMDEIRAAYERSIKLYDADNVALYPVGDPAEVEELKKLLLEAMEILTDEDLRVEYDRSLGLGGSPEAAEIDARAAEARKQGEVEVVHAAEEEVHAHPPKLIEEPQGADAADPRQLVMIDVIARAEAVHSSTAPRYAISYIPHAPPPPPQPEVQALRPAEDEGEAPSAEPAPETKVEPKPVAEPVPEAKLEPKPAPEAPVPSAEAPRPAPAAKPGSRLEEAPVMAQEGAIKEAETALAQISAHVQRRSEERAAGAQAGQAAQVHRPRPLDIPPDAEFNGELLRQVRKNRGFSVQQLAERTRISSRHIENVEADRYDALPPSVYLRGILMNVARELGVDPVRVSKSYLGLVEKVLGKLK